MGDRGNVRIKQEGDGSDVYLYTHCEGASLPYIVQAALLRGKDYLGDDSYLARIVFSEMTKDDPFGTTGYGITTSPADDRNHPCITVDCAAGTVTIEARGGPGGTATIAEFLSMTPAKIRLLGWE